MSNIDPIKFCTYKVMNRQSVCVLTYCMLPIVMVSTILAFISDPLKIHRIQKTCLLEV